MSENTLTMDYIITALDSLESIGLLRKSFTYNQDEIVFIRRLRHLQHLCRRIQREITDGVKVTGNAIIVYFSVTNKNISYPHVSPILLDCLFF
jgi:hypothetical protein